MKNRFDFIVAAGAKTTPPQNIGVAIIALAEHFANLVETVPNKAWDDPSTPGPDSRARELKALLIEAGQTPGDAYCMTFAKGIWAWTYAKAGAPLATLSAIQKLLGPSVLGSFHACQAAGLVTRQPIPGAIMFMQNGHKGTGHAGIVKEVHQGAIVNIEGNTSPSPATPEEDRQGDGVFDGKTRRLSFDYSDGLHIVGFINPFLL